MGAETPKQFLKLNGTPIVILGAVTFRLALRREPPRTARLRSLVGASGPAFSCLLQI
jgi:hypothetical protein